MAKTNSERQREYRERKKQQDNESYMAKERSRARDRRKKVADMTPEELLVFREKNRERYHRRHTKQARQSPNHDDSFSDQVVPTFSPLIVMLPALKPKPLKIRRRTSRAVAKAHYAMKQLKAELKITRRRAAMYRKRNQRLRVSPVVNQGAFTPVCNVSNATLTPKSKTDAELRYCGISPKTALPIRKKLLFTNTVVEEIKSAQAHNTQTNSQVIKRVVSGRIVKKYRLASMFHREFNVNRRLAIHNKSVVLQKRTRLQRLRNDIEDQVITFLSRDDNSRMNPGKADAKKMNGIVKQTRILNDYMGNLYLKFCSECHQINISRASFHRIRPKYILLSKFLSRNSCLCQKHQNMALKLKSLRNKLPSEHIPINPDSFLTKFANPEQIHDLLAKINDSDDITYEEWKRVQISDKKKKMKIVSITNSKSDYTNMLKSEVDVFRAHVDRVHCQYTELRKLKEHLPDGHAIIQMDFAENYSCSTAEEIQSAYWNQSQVTIHPAVIYYGVAENNIMVGQHKSVVFISDVDAHNSAMVRAILMKLVPITKQFVPNLTHIHYYTDSPTSQYRNKSMFHFISNHHIEYPGVTASWDYFEAGHGKGPCDGVGGTVKRQADQAVKQGAIIQDASDFFRWAQTTEKSIKYVFVDINEYNEQKVYLDENTICPISGTMKMHAVRYEGGKIFWRSTSCNCLNSSCLRDCAWNEVLISVTHVSVIDTDDTSPANDVTNLAPDDFVIIVYDGMCFVSKVMEIDDDDIQVSSMVQKGSRGTISFVWPRVVDEIWVKHHEVIGFISKPLPMKRGFKLDAISLAKYHDAALKLSVTL